METPHSIIYLYSKFSPYCKNFSDLISNLNFITPVCIDSKDVRKKITTSKLTIDVVPCVLLVYGSGQIEKYEGENCFRWAEALIKTERQPPEIIVDDSEPLEIKVESPKKKKNKPPPPPIESDDDDIVEEEKESEPVLPSKPTSNKLNEQKIELTSMEDIIGDEKEETPFDMRLLQRQSNDNLPIKKDSASNNLMAKAQEMQKMRDELDSTSKKPPPFPAQK
jgi:hypothetical protein